MTLLPSNVAFAAAETISCGTTGNRTISVGTYDSEATDGGSEFSSGADLTLNTGGGSDCTFTISQDQSSSAISLASLTIGDGVTLTQDATGTTADTYSQLKFSISGALTVETGGAIDVSGKGYCGGDTTCNSGYTGYTGGNTQTGGSTENFAGGSGGAHGGRGAEGYSANAATVYDSVSNPVLPGGGGAGSQWYYSPAANGGGVVVVTAGSMVVDGSILAEDNMSFSTYAGGGGGTINLTVSGTITGSGTLSVAAKDSSFTDELGGGGRMAIKNYSSLSGTLTLKVNGGNGSGYYDGSSGTLYLKPSGQTYGDLYLDNGSADNFYHNTILTYPVPASDQNPQFGGGYVFNSINVANYGILSISTDLDDVQDGSDNLDRQIYSLTCEAADDNAANGEIIYSGSYGPSAGLNLMTSVYDYVCADPVFLVGLESTSGTAAESVTSGSFTIGASGTADGDVTVDYAVSVSSTATGTDDYILADGTATIANGTSSEEIPFTIVDDIDRESSETLIVTLSNLTGGTLTADDTFTYTITDNDTPVVVITESGGITGATSVAEGSSGDDYTIVLGTQPSADVTITITGDADVSVDDDTKVFTSANWDTPQTVNVTAVNDATAEGSHSGTITHSAASSDVDYGGIDIDDVTVSISDNDMAGITKTESSSSTVVYEGGATDSYTLVLNTQPTASVAVDISYGAECSLSPDSITFTTSDWDTPQTITVTAVDDTDQEGIYSDSCMITHSTTSSDSAYNNLSGSMTNVFASVYDNDTPNVTINTVETNAYEDGTDADFTAVLSSQPTDDVTISLTSADTDQLTLSPASLVFTTSNWNTPQHVTGIAVDDSTPEAQNSYAVSYVVTSNDTGYAGFSISSTYIYVRDNDMVVLTESGGTTDVTEGGATDTYDVVLGMDPGYDTVYIYIYTSDGETTTSPTSLTFTTADWSTPQTVTVTAVDDADQECAPQTGTITYSVFGGYGSFYGVTLADTTVNITDNEAACAGGAGVTITESSASTDVTEGGATDTYDIVLDSEPTDTVTIDLSVGADLSLDDVSLDFTTLNWETPQTVTVTAVNDDIDEDGETPSITSAATSNDTDYQGISIAGVTVNVTDNDTAGFTVGAISGNTTEAGGTATFTVALNSEPTANVTIPVTSADTSEGTVSDSSLTFTSANWDTPQEVTVAGANDTLDDGNVGYTITLGAATSSDTKYDTLNPSDVSVTNNDNDASGVTVSNISGVTTEAGGTATFTVVLTAEPTGDVVIDSASNDSGEGSVTGGGTLTFTTSNWSTPQTVTVTGQNDDVDDGNIGYSIVVTTNTDDTEDTTYDAINPDDVSVTNSDNDTVGVTVNAISGATTEGGGTATFTMALNTEPTGNVVINSASDDSSEGSVTSGGTLTFTTSNWATPQTVTVTGQNDSVDDGNVAYNILVTTDTGNTADSLYDAINPADVAATNNDDTDTAGITVGAISDSGTTTEAGGTATFTVVLDTQPSANVVIGVSSSDTTEGTVSPSSLTFTSENWSTPQTVTVTGANDTLDDGDVTYSVVTAAATSSDSAYNTLNAADVSSITNTDNDSSGVTVSTISGNTTEAGGTATYTVVLTAQPTGNVEIDSASNDSTEGTVTTGGTLTFTTSNWNTPQTVTVTGAEDYLDDGDVAYSVVVTVDADNTADTTYDGINPADVSVTTTDNDTSGFTIGTISGATTEAGGTATFTVKLAAQPTADVTMGLSSSDTGEGTVSPSTLTFTSANWNTNQLVTITGVNDDVDDGNIVFSIVTAAAGSSDSNYNTLNPSDVSVTNTDNDTLGLEVGAISGDTSESGDEATFTVALGSQPTDDVVVSVTSSNTEEGTVDEGSTLTFTPENWSDEQTVTLTGVDDEIDDGDVEYTITFAVSADDPSYDGVSVDELSVTNTDDDTAGITVSEISGDTAEAGDSATYTLVLTAQPTADVVISIVSSDATEGTVSVSSITFTAEDWNVPQTVTVSGVDDTDDDDDVAYTIAMDTVTSSDDAYSNLEIEPISLSNTDDDVAAPAAAAASGSSFFTTLSRSIQNAAANSDADSSASDAAPAAPVGSREAELKAELGVDEVVTNSFESDGKTDKLVAVLNEEARTEFVIEQDTEITTEDGEPFTGNLEIPTLVAEREITTQTAEFNSERAFVNAIFVDTGEEHVYFNKPVVVTLPLSDSSLTANRLEVWTFNEKFGTWQKLETKVIVDYKNRTISFEVNRFSYVAVLENQVFEDTATHWASKYILVLTKEGVLKGIGNGKFEPDRSITRAEMAKVIMLAFGYEVEKTTDSKFSDVQRVHWGYDYVNTAAEKGIVKGYADGTFKPDAPVTRVEALKMVLKAARKDTSDVGTLFRLIYPDVDAKAWYIGYLKFAAYRDLVDQVADQSFMPNAPITRAEVAKIVIKTRDLE